MKTIEDYRKELITLYVSANEVKGFKNKNKNIAMWQLLSEGKIVPISDNLWMVTKEGKKEVWND